MNINIIVFVQKLIGSLSLQNILPITMNLKMRLKELREKANSAVTVYQKTRLDYAYMEMVLKEASDLYEYRHEIRTFQQLCLIYNTVYDEAIYSQFLDLLQKMMDKMD